MADKKINVELLREVRAAILKWPNYYNQGNYGANFKYDPQHMQEPECGSAACIAGWSVVLGDKCSLDGMVLAGVMARARQLLGVSWLQSEKLFYHKAGHEYLWEVTAQEAATAIDNFIASNGESCYASATE